MSMNAMISRCVVALVVAGLMWGGAAAAQTAPEVELGVYVKGRFVSAHGYSVKAPARWTRLAPNTLSSAPAAVREQLRPEPIDALFMDERAQRLGSSFPDNITVAAVGEKIPLMDEALRGLGAQWEREYRASHADFTMLGVEVAQLKRQPVLRMRGTYSVAGQPLHVRRLYVVGAAGSVIITCTMDPARMKARIAQCDALAASLKFR